MARTRSGQAGRQVAGASRSARWLYGKWPVLTLHPDNKRTWATDPLIIMIGGFGGIGKAQRLPGQEPEAYSKLRSEK